GSYPEAATPPSVVALVALVAKAALFAASALCTVPTVLRLILDPVTAPFLILLVVTALFLICLVPTLFFGNENAAYPVPPSATNSAVSATAIEGDGIRRTRFIRPPSGAPTPLWDGAPFLVLIPDKVSLVLRSAAIGCYRWCFFFGPDETTKVIVCP